MNKKKENVKWGMEELRNLRNRWAEMPEKEAEAEQERLFADAMRRIAEIRAEKAPSSVKPMTEREQLDAVRSEIYEKTKHMDSFEMAQYLNASARELAKEHGFTLTGKRHAAKIKSRITKAKPHAKSHS